MTQITDLSVATKIAEALFTIGKDLADTSFYTEFYPSYLSDEEHTALENAEFRQKVYTNIAYAVGTEESIFQKFILMDYFVFLCSEKNQEQLSTSNADAGKRHIETYVFQKAYDLKASDASREHFEMTNALRRHIGLAEFPTPDADIPFSRQKLTRQKHVEFATLFTAGEPGVSEFSSEDLSDMSDEEMDDETKEALLLSLQPASTNNNNNNNENSSITQQITDKLMQCGTAKAYIAGCTFLIAHNKSVTLFTPEEHHAWNKFYPSILLKLADAGIEAEEAKHIVALDSLWHTHLKAQRKAPTEQLAILQKFHELLLLFPFAESFPKEELQQCYESYTIPSVAVIVLNALRKAVGASLLEMPTSTNFSYFSEAAQQDTTSFARYMKQRIAENSYGVCLLQEDSNTIFTASDHAYFKANKYKILPLLDASQAVQHAITTFMEKEALTFLERQAPMPRSLPFPDAQRSSLGGTAGGSSSMTMESFIETTFGYKRIKGGEYHFTREDHLRFQEATAGFPDNAPLSLEHPAVTLRTVKKWMENDWKKIEARPPTTPTDIGALASRILRIYEGNGLPLNQEELQFFETHKEKILATFSDVPASEKSESDRVKITRFMAQQTQQHFPVRKEAPTPPPSRATSPETSESDGIKITYLTTQQKSPTREETPTPPPSAIKQQIVEKILQGKTSTAVDGTFSHSLDNLYLSSSDHAEFCDTKVLIAVIELARSKIQAALRANQQQAWSNAKEEIAKKGINGSLFKWIATDYLLLISEPHRTANNQQKSASIDALLTLCFEHKTTFFSFLPKAVITLVNDIRKHMGHRPFSVVSSAPTSPSTSTLENFTLYLAQKMHLSTYCLTPYDHYLSKEEHRYLDEHYDSIFGSMAFSFCTEKEFRAFLKQLHKERALYPELGAFPAKLLALFSEENVAFTDKFTPEEAASIVENFISNILEKQELISNVSAYTTECILAANTPYIFSAQAHSYWQTLLEPILATLTEFGMNIAEIKQCMALDYLWHLVPDARQQDTQTQLDIFSNVIHLFKLFPLDQKISEEEVSRLCSKHTIPYMSLALVDRLRVHVGASPLIGQVTEHENQPSNNAPSHASRTPRRSSSFREENASLKETSFAEGITRDSPSRPPSPAL